MRVGLDGFPLATPKTGIGHYTFELARALALIAPSDEFQLISPVAFTDSTVRDGNWPPNLLAVNPNATSIRRRWWAVGLPLYVRNGALDIFHGTNYDVPLWNRRRTVVTIHDLSILLHAEKHEAHLARRARRRLPVMARSASMIITPTESVKREVCENLGVKSDRVAVTPEAPRRSFQPMPLEQTVETKRRLSIEDEFILFVGTVEPRKNLLTLVRAFDQILRHTLHRPQLVIAGGEGWLMDELIGFIAKSGLGDRLLLTGYLSDEDLCALYSSCKVFVYPSIYEGFGLPPLEAMACGAPVIASRIPVFHETLGGAACLVEATDVEELARNIVAVFEDEARRNMLSSAGQQHAREFSWDKTARLTLGVYHQVVSKPNRHAIAR